MQRFHTLLVPVCLFFLLLNVQTFKKGNSLRGRRKKGRGRGKEKSAKNPPPFSLPPYPLPLSTPATQAKKENEVEIA